MKRSAVCGFAFAVLIAVFLSGCSGGNGTVAASNVSASRRVGSLEYGLMTTKATFAPGEQVPLVFTVRNVGLQTVDVILGACEYFDTRVTSAGQTVWQQSRIGGCGGQVTFISIAPGETKTYQSSWPQTDQSGNPVPAGQYTITTWYQPFNPDIATLAPGNQEVNESPGPIQISVQ